MPSYQSIFDRVGLLIAANVNSIVDKALGANSVAVFDEYVNRMNGALDALQTAEGVERGRSKTLDRQIETLEGEVGQLDQDVDRLLAQGARSLAAARQAVFNTKSELLTQLREDRAECGNEIEKLSNSRAKLSAQIEVSKAQRQRLVGLIEQTKAAKLRHDAQDRVRISAPDRYRTDDLIEKERQKKEIAEGMNEAEALTLDQQIDDVLGAQDLELQLQAREAKRLGAGQRQQLPEPKKVEEESER